MWKSIWNDPVWSKVISAAILAAAAALGTYFLDWWPVMGRYLSEGIAFSAAKSLIPNWLTAVLGLLAIPTLLLLLALAWQLLRPEKPSAADWEAYTSDNFFGLLWRWRYIGQSMSEMHTFCPHCDFQGIHRTRAHTRQLIASRLIANIVILRLAPSQSHIIRSQTGPNGSRNRSSAMARGIPRVAPNPLHEPIGSQETQDQ